jgi:uncharacterized protein with FMN-binding domain
MKQPLRFFSLAAIAVATTVPLAANLVTSPLHAFAKTVTKKYTGPLVNMPWGPVQAVIYVKAKKITKVKIVTNPENTRSLFIDQQVVPLLQQETLKAQNASKVDLFSGATMTSEAYVISLYKVMKKAHLKVS